MNVSGAARGLQYDVGSHRRCRGFRGIAQDRAFDHRLLGRVIGEAARRSPPVAAAPQLLSPNGIARKQQKRER